MADSSEMRMFENGLARGRQIGEEQSVARILGILEENAFGEYRKVMLTPRLISLITVVGK